MKETALPELSAGPYLTSGSDSDARLLGSECKSCGQRVFPPSAVCPSCMSEDMMPLPLSREGTLYTYSVLHVGARGWDAPYMVGYVDLPEGVRVFTHLIDMEPGDLKCDMRVSLRITQPVVNTQGREVLRFKFGPVEREIA